MKPSMSLAGIVLAAFGAAALGATASASATIVKRLTVVELTRRADLVVQGTIVGRTAQWNPEHTRIYTVTEVRVAESLKGGAADGTVLAVRQLGGSLDGFVQTVSGNARFTPGEEVILFLDRDEALPWHYVIGMAQGKYTVSPSPAGARVARDLSDLAFIRPADEALMTPAATAAPQASAASDAISDFKATVRAAVRAP